MKESVIKYTCDSCGYSSMYAEDYLRINVLTMDVLNAMGLGEKLEHICIECRRSKNFNTLEMSEDGELIIPNIKSILRKAIWGYDNDEC